MEFYICTCCGAMFYYEPSAWEKCPVCNLVKPGADWNGVYGTLWYEMHDLDEYYVPINANGQQ